MDIQNTYTCNICGFTTSNINDWRLHQYYNDHDLIVDDDSDVGSLDSLASLGSVDYDAGVLDIIMNNVVFVEPCDPL